MPRQLELAETEPEWILEQKKEDDDMFSNDTIIENDIMLDF